MERLMLRESGERRPEEREHIDMDHFRDVLGRFASGVTVVAAADEDGTPAGLACQSFASLSLDPPLVLVCVGRTSSSWPKVEAAGRFGISVLAEDQQAVCAALGRRGGDKFAGVSWSLSRNGAVRIDGALAHIDCAVREVVEAGDHYVVIARVLELAAREDGNPLLYFRSDFARGVFR
ncbi:flavin reductase family protein [Streptomyces sp. NPDC004783]|uniref:flavin reductase family protein n=1 Tax=Streptomyces sp. NPDC004783 TaxID=3154459 RepID=UPI0033AD3650